MGYSFRLATRVLLYASSHRQDNTWHGLCYTNREALAGTRNSSMGSPHEGLIWRPIAPWANALTTELQLLKEYVIHNRGLTDTPIVTGAASPGPRSQRGVAMGAPREGRRHWPEGRLPRRLWSVLREMGQRTTQVTHTLYWLMFTHACTHTYLHTHRTTQVTHTLYWLMFILTPNNSGNTHTVLADVHTHIHTHRTTKVKHTLYWLMFTRACSHTGTILPCCLYWVLFISLA